MFVACCCPQIAACEEDIERLQGRRTSAQVEAEEADAAAQQALETGHAEVSFSSAKSTCLWVNILTSNDGNSCNIRQLLLQ